MNKSRVASIISKHDSGPVRRALAAMLLAALILAVLAGSALAASNLLLNSSFETDSNGDGIPNDWGAGSITPADKRVCNQSYAGACSFKMVGDGIEKFLYQGFAETGGSGEMFKLTFWIKARNIPAGGNLTIRFYIFHSDGNSSNLNQKIIPTGDTGWTKYTLNLSSTEAFNLLRVYIYEDNGPSGKVWVDKMNLVAVP